MDIQEILNRTWMQLPRGRLSVAVVLFQVTTQPGIAMIVLTSGEKEAIPKTSQSFIAI